MIAAFTFLGINKSNQRSSDIVADNAKMIESHYSAEEAVEYLIQKYLNTGVTDTTIDFSSTNKKTTGTINPLLTGSKDSLEIIGRDSTYGYNVIVKAMVVGTGQTINIGKVSPLTFVASGGISLDNITGSAFISGWDMGIPNTEGVPGLSVPTESAKEQAENELDAVQGAVVIDGKGGQVGVNDAYSYQALSSLLAQVSNDADATVAKINGNSTYGSQLNPVVVYAANDLKVSGSVTGYGILAVNGSIDITGSLSWNGLILSVIPENGDSNGGNNKGQGHGQGQGQGQGNDFDFRLGGSCAVHGGIIVSASDNIDIKIHGSAQSIHNSNYLKDAQDIINAGNADDTDSTSQNKSIESINWSSSTN